jgi:hypothetical protein
MQKKPSEYSTMEYFSAVPSYQIQAFPYVSGGTTTPPWNICREKFGKISGIM